MPRAIDEAGNVWEVDAQGNPVRLVTPAGQQPSPDYQVDQATVQTQIDRSQADAANASVDANVNAATAPAQVREANANATVAEVGAAQAVQEAQNAELVKSQAATRQSFRTDNVLRAIREARRIAQERGGVGYASLLSALPETAARDLQSALDPIKGNLAFNRLQEMRDESKTGGAVGNVSDNELRLLASTVASLDQGASPELFLERLDAIERQFINAQLSNDGLSQDDPRRMELMRSAFGYTGVLEGEEPQNTARLGRVDASETATTLPPEYQAAHLRYLRDNWGNVDPATYARFRSGLDEQYGFTPDVNAYAAAAPQFNQAAQQGVSPEQLGAVPNPVREMSMLEQGVNYAARTAPGTAFATATNAFAGGLPARLGGEQQGLELMREARPVSSFVGEMVGSGIGAAATGGIAGRMGASLLAKPLASEALHGTIYGATQDDNTLRGAGMGLGGAFAGSLAGRQIGQMMPETFAPNAIRNADESVPSLEQIRGLEGEQYAAAQAAGEVASGEATQEMYERALNMLRGETKITPAGRMVNTEGPTNDAMRLLEDFAGQEMRPRDASSVRNVLGEGRASPDPAQRRISNMLVNEFDDWAQPALPGIEQARRTAQRRIEGEQMQRAGVLANRRGQRMKGNDEGDALRTRFGQLDDAITEGRQHFTDQTAEAIGRVANGDAITNAARQLGKFGLQNPLTAALTGGGAGSAALALGAEPVTAGIVGAGTTLFGTGARKLANARTQRAAREAELTALGGEEYVIELAKAYAEAMRNAGALTGGFGAAGASMATRQSQPLPR